MPRGKCCRQWADPWTKAIMLSWMLQWSYSTEQRAPRGTDPAIVLHQISCCCSFGQELIIIQINKQRAEEVRYMSDSCVCVCVSNEEWYYKLTWLLDKNDTVQEKTFSQHNCGFRDWLNMDFFATLAVYLHISIFVWLHHLSNRNKWIAENKSSISTHTRRQALGTEMLIQTVISQQLLERLPWHFVDIHVPQRMNLHDIGDPLTFHLAALAGQIDHLIQWNKSNLLNRLAQNEVQTLLMPCLFL